MKKILAFLLVFVMVMGLAGCGGGGKAPAEKPNYFSMSINGVFDEDGKSVLPVMNGEVYTLKEGNTRSVLSPDRQTAVYLNEDGELYAQNVGSGESRRLAENVDYIAFVRNAGVIYLNDEGIAYRTMFDEENPTMRLGEVYDGQAANENLNIAYAVDGAIYFLAESSSEREKIGTYQDDVTFHYVTNSGTSVVWSDHVDAQETVYLYENGEKTRIGEYGLRGTYYYYSTTAVEFDTSEQYMTVMNWYDNTMYMKKVGEDAVRIRLSDEPVNNYGYTAKGYFDRAEFDPAGGLYVFVEGEDNDLVYWIDENGEREKVLSDVTSVAFSGGYVFYRDGDDVLRYAAANGASIEPEKIASDVERTLVAPNGYVFYLRDIDTNDCGTLYVYHAGDEEPQKIASDVYRYNLNCSEDGRTVFYFRDYDETGDSETEVGTLYLYTVGDESPTKISGDVILGSVTSGISYGYVLKNSFLYEKYSYEDDDTVYFNWAYYNGTESVTMVKDVTDEYIERSSAREEAPAAEAPALEAAP